MEQGKQVSIRLKELERGAPDYWTFGGRDQRVGAHALFHYPAMMVPQMQGAILDVIRDVVPEHDHVYDPFVGSGTTLVETMTRGLRFTGIDINPLALLVTKVKAAVVEPSELRAAEKRVYCRMRADRGRGYFVQFPNQAKWFSASASIGLSRIARAIEREPEVRVRRVFWVALARAIRYVCNSRRSTYKLHVSSSPSQMECQDALAVFEAHASAVVATLTTHHEQLVQAGVLRRGSYNRPIHLKVGNILDESLKVQKASIVITSPPYGDNKTTVPYGQYSYLPLRWIPGEDIEEGLSLTLSRNTHSTDTASLGGSALNAVERGETECANSSAYKNTMRKLKSDESAKKRFAAFAADLKQAVQRLAKDTDAGGFHVWTVGERRIAGHQVPMARLVTEFLDEHSIQVVHSASRRILSKRMASRNTLSDTMDAEQVLIAQRAKQ